MLDDFGQSEIRKFDFERVLLGDKYVVRFDVAMRNLGVMEIAQRTQNLLSHGPCRGLTQGPLLVEVCLQVAMGYIFHYDVQIVALIVVLDEFDNVWVP